MIKTCLKKLNQAGFTLVEILAAMVIFTMIIGASYSLISQSTKVVSDQVGLASMRDDIRKSLTLLTKDIQESVAVGHFSPFQFTQENDAVVFYEYDAGKKQVLRNFNNQQMIFMAAVEHFEIIPDGAYFSFQVNITIKGESHNLVVTRRIAGGSKSGGTIKGVVHNQTSNPIVGAGVSAKIDGAEYWAMTDASGQYNLFVPAGIYEVSASAFGYLSSVCSGIEVLADQEKDLNFTLKAVVESSAKAIISYSLPGQAISPAIIHPVARTVEIVVAKNTNVTNLVAEFTLSPGATAQVGSVMQASGDTANNFTNPVKYTITAQDGSTNDWYVNVIVTGTAEGGIVWKEDENGVRTPIPFSNKIEIKDEGQKLIITSSIGTRTTYDTFEFIAPAGIIIEPGVNLATTHEGHTSITLTTNGDLIMKGVSLTSSGNASNPEQIKINALGNVDISDAVIAAQRTILIAAGKNIIANNAILINEKDNEQILFSVGSSSTGIIYVDNLSARYKDGNKYSPQNIEATPSDVVINGTMNEGTIKAR